MEMTARSYPGRPLLEGGGQVLPAESKSVRVHSFEVPAGTAALALRFDYEPRTCRDPAINAPLVDAALSRHHQRREALGAKTMEAHKRSSDIEPLYRVLHNLMNVVLIDPQGRWRGRWDRNPSSKTGGALVLAEGQASPGFLAGPIEPGTWTAAVEAHGIYGAPVSYRVELAAIDTETAGEILDEGPRSGPQPRPSRRGGPRWYFGELHSHTVHSDGRNQLFELAGKAFDLGIDFVALTDHNTTSGLREAIDLPITIIPGAELTTFHGHHPIYGITEMPPWHHQGRVIGLEEIGRRLRPEGVLVSVAHPFKIGDPICTGCRMREDLDPGSFDLIEVWYRRWDARETDNEAAYALWNQLWEDGHRVTAVAARDWHGAGQEEPFPGPMPFTGVFAQDDTPEALIAGLRSGRVIMSGGPILDLGLDGSSLSIALSRAEGGGELRILHRGKVVERIEVGGDQTIERTLGEPGWYRAELWRGSEPRVISNHVEVAG